MNYAHIVQQLDDPLTTHQSNNHTFVIHFGHQCLDI
jgi:hypothetical protein